MRFLFTVLLLATVSLCLRSTPASAQGEFATLQPTFQETGHVAPEPTAPPPRSTAAEYIDVVALFVALSAASYLALKARSRRGIMLLSVLCLGYFGFWRQGCVCPVGAIQNVMQALTDKTYAVPLSVVLFFALPLLFALFFGRTFCAAVCPLGAIQDVVVLRPVKVPVWISGVLGLVPYLYLGVSLALVAGGAGYLICRYDPFVGFFRLSASFSMLVFGGGMLVLSMFVGRPYCRFLCPYGVLLNGCSQLSQRHVTITPDECVQCRLCEDACPFDAIQKPTPAKPPAPRRTELRRLAGLLVLLPVLTVGGAYLGSRMGPPLARMSDTVQLAERLRLEESGRADGGTVETDAYRRTKEPSQRLYVRALGIRHRIGRAGWFLGAFMGVVIGGRLLALSVRRRRTDYVPHRGECVSCARCFRYCPKDAAERKTVAVCTASTTHIIAGGEGANGE